MVLKSHELLSDVSVIRTYGSCSSNGASVLPLKWKPRNTSAVRDFPPGCGPIVQPVTAASQEPNSSSSMVNNGANDADTEVKQVESLSNDVSKSTEDGKMELIVDLHKELQKGVDCEISGLDNADIEANDKGGSFITQKIKFPQRRVSAVRDFPPYCGLNATEPTEEERIRINGKKSSGIEHKGSERNAIVTDTVVDNGEESNGSVKDDFLDKTQSNESNESLMANQDSMVDEESNKNVEIGKIETEIIEKVCQELVVYRRDNSLKKKSLIDESDEESVKSLEDESFENSETTQVVMPIRSFAPIQEKNIKKVNGQNKKVNHKKLPKKRSLVDTNNFGFVKGERSLVLCLMAPSFSFSPNIIPSITPKMSKPKVSPTPSTTPKNSKSKKVKAVKESSSFTGTLDMVVRKEEEPCDVETEDHEEDECPNSNEVDVTLPPFGPRSSDSARNRIRKALRLFQVLCRKLLQGEESKTSEFDQTKVRRVDLKARQIIQENGKAPDLGKKTYGSIPGVEVGDEFQYRAELALVGIHWVLQGGIDYIKHGKTNIPVAVSVVASGGYDNEVNKPECLIYSGSGGIGKDKQVEDQKLERGNVALKNNIDLKLPVRVIRGYKGKSTESSSSSSDSKSKILTTYIYDGLYTVEKYWRETGPHGNLVFKFELKRIPGQPELALREVKSKKFKTREGVCVDDITNGKETIRISAVNTIDDEKPPSFNYITKIVYPDWYRRPVPPPTGCDCVGRCSSKRCKCAAKNGGEIPYNHNGAIVEAKPLVYECGPACMCPPSCYNRVTQHGMKIPLEIFKTESRGWGVRSLTSISSGSFICEYVGELLEDTEAEKRTGNDEYLFDIGQNYSDTGMGVDAGTDLDAGTDGFTIDAAHYGNVGRFINHSCTPNLYAQNVLYDQEDKRMPHIMLFAAENIPPLQELTYHYNYAVDTVHDLEGNIKVKRCFCGSSECTGRLY